MSDADLIRLRAKAAVADLLAPFALGSLALRTGTDIGDGPGMRRLTDALAEEACRYGPTDAMRAHAERLVAGIVDRLSAEPAEVMFR